MRKPIDYKLASDIAKKLGLVYSSSFSNTEPSRLCYEYRMETGMAFEGYGCDDLFNFIRTKDDDSNDQYKAVLYLNKSSFGIRDEDDLLDIDRVKAAETMLRLFNNASGFAYQLEDLGW